MLRSIFLTVILVLAAACTPTSTGAPPTHTFETFVTIEAPRIGTVIYSGTIYVAGTTNNSMNDAFQIEVITANGDVIAESTVTPIDGQWNVQLPHAYTGDPTEVTIIASVSDGETSAELDLASAVLSPIGNRPDDHYGLILQPTNNDTAGGEQIPVFGIVSGPGIQEIIVALTMGDEEISRTTAAVDYPNKLDEIPWQVDLLTDNRTGPVKITLGYEDETGNFAVLDEVELVLTAVAG